MVQEKTFREDLFYRLDGNIIDIPPLRERGDDVVLLFKYFCKKFREEHACTYDVDLNKIKSELLSYHWQGNVRELQKFCEYLFVIYDRLDTEIVIKEMKQKKSGFRNSNINLLNKMLANPDYIKATEEFERNYLQYHLRNNNNKVSVVAKLLNLNRSTVYQKISKYGIEI
jgi:transcriptional regulator with PAS, ATPase and Fis domain